MKQTKINRVLAAVLVMVMVVAMLPISVFATDKTYVLDVTADMEAFAPGTHSNGASAKFGTEGYFILHYGEKMKVDGSNKTFSDGVTASQRINFQSKTDTTDWSYSVEFTCSGPATVKFWWVSGGDNRRMALYGSDGNIIAEDGTETTKNSLYITEFAVAEAGTYYLGVPDGSNYLFRMEVTESGSTGTQERKKWSEVSDPVITAVTDNGTGNLIVNVDADVSKDGGDQLTVTMFDANGKKLDSGVSVSGKSHTLTFTPDASGKYSFVAELSREDEDSKKTSEKATASFVLPLKEPVLISATNQGGGSVELEWTAVDEAEKYEVYCNGEKVGTATGTSFVVKGLTVGAECTFKVAAIRGTESVSSAEFSAKVTQEAQQAWYFTAYGPSTNLEKNGFEGDLNVDGSVTVYSEGGKGKIVPASTDGLAFYYTKVPTQYNFTLRAKVTVDSWTLSNGQEGFGLMVSDRVGESGNTASVWNNQYMALASKIEYRFEGEEVVLSGGTKYSMKMGLGVIAKTGVTLANLPLLEAGNTDAINKQFSSVTKTLEWAAGSWEKDAGTYNIIGNYTTMPEGTIENELKTTFILEIQKNNTGYFITYYAEDGTVLCRHKFYDPEALNQLDKDYVYAGFFAARNARATFSDVQFSTVLASEDAPAEEKPVTKIDPTVAIASGAVTTKDQYELLVDANVNGTMKILLDGNVLLDGETIVGGERYRKVISLGDYGQHRVRVQFTPDPNQDLGVDTVLSSTKDVFADVTVLFNKGNYHTKTIYVSPNGLPNGNGTPEYPYDIYTAVNNVVPGQTIVLMEGTYKMEDTLRIQRGMDGTEDAPIRMVADPAATTRPVLNFQRKAAGIVHGGDYWYFYGFDVTGTIDGQKGFQVSGSYNVLDQIHAYENGNTGIQLSRYAGSDLFADWPAHNLILNCTSYRNYDKGFEDADGFAAKLTIGEGNVFDGCVAYNNADDGWDLYAKVETGPIGSVTIRNCVAYSNGFVPGVEGQGNGNGFKMGGESLTGKHVLENSYAFWNLAKGIDSNSCPDIIVKNSVSYNNGSYNVAFYTNNAANTDFVGEGIVSFRDSTSPYAYTGADNLKGKGSQKQDQYVGKTTYYWQGDSSINSAGKTITADMFVSLTFSGEIVRKADGTIDMQGFLVLNDKAPANTGANMGGIASAEIVLDLEGDHADTDVWVNLDAYLHWHECDCGAKTDLAEHTFTWIIDKEATPEATGLKHEECTVCGYKRAAVTTYYENPNPQPDPTEPTQPAQPTQPSEPTQPGATEPVATEPGACDTEQNQPDNTVLIVVIVIVVVLAAAGAVVVIFLKKKKK